LGQNNDLGDRRFSIRRVLVELEQGLYEGQPGPWLQELVLPLLHVFPVSLDGLVGVFLAELSKHSVRLLQVEERGGRDADDECAGEVEGDNRLRFIQIGAGRR
jgi:hypothetical protein